jgi:hypothetical protein
MNNPVASYRLLQVKFCKDVFDVYDKHKIDEHIKRPD